MARIRTVKPEFWEDETVATISRDARLLFIAVLNMADDEGLLRWTGAYVKSSAFIYDDDLAVEDVERLMAELTASGMVFEYRGGKAHQRLAWIPNFRRHQVINRPQPSKLPPPSIQNGQVLVRYCDRDSWTCHLCSGAVTRDHDKQRLWPSLDHLTPRSAGGSDYPSNLKISHDSCNRARRDRPVEEFTGSPATRYANRSVNASVNAPVSTAVNGSVPEREEEREGKGTEQVAPNGAAADAAPTFSQRAESITRSYTGRVRLSNHAAVKGVVGKAMRSNDWTDQEITAALARLADDGRSVTADALRYELAGRPPPNGRASPRQNGTDEKIRNTIALGKALDQQQRREIAP